MFDIMDLHIFVRIANVGSISGAARALVISKSSVSRSLVRLEGASGAALVERLARELRLTDAGNLLLRHARRILDDVSEAEDALGQLVGAPRGTLRVNLPFTFAVDLLMPMLPGFLKRYPDLRISLFLETRPVEVLGRDADMAIQIGPLADSELIARKLATFRLLLCASPAYLATHGTPQTINDLHEHSLIGKVDQRTTWRFKKVGGAVHEFEFSPAIVISEQAAAQTLVTSGGGIGRFPDFIAIKAVAQGTMVRVLPDFEGETIDAHALYPSHRSLSPKVRVFVDALLAHLKEALAASPASSG